MKTIINNNVILLSLSEAIALYTKLVFLRGCFFMFFDYDFVFNFFI